MSTPQNIIIIGASVAGHNAVNELIPHLPSTHRILLIDALAYSSWPIASLRAAVVPGWEKRVTQPLTKEAIFPAGSIHQVIAPNKVVELRESSVVLEHPFEGSTEVPFFKAIVATGASQGIPMRPVSGSSEAEYQAALVKYQEDFARSKKVLIVGGGAVGLELAGELREQHPDQEITIVHAKSHVLDPTADVPRTDAGHHSYSSPPTPLKLSKTIESQLAALHINLILSDRVSIPSAGSVSNPSEWDGSVGAQNGIKTVKLDSGKVVQADFVFISTGNRPNVSLVQNADPKALSSGLIAVDEYLRIVSTNPKSALTSNYYAAGDAASAPGWKTSQGAQAEGAGAAANILAEVRGKPVKPFARPRPDAMFIPLGSKGGAGALPLPLLGVVSAPSFLVSAGKGKKLFVEDGFYGRYKGSKKPVAPPVTVQA